MVIEFYLHAWSEPSIHNSHPHPFYQTLYGMEWGELWQHACDRKAKWWKNGKCAFVCSAVILVNAGMLVNGLGLGFNWKTSIKLTSKHRKIGTISGYDIWIWWWWMLLIEFYSTFTFSLLLFFKYDVWLGLLMSGLNDEQRFKHLYLCVRLAREERCLKGHRLTRNIAGRVIAV